MSGTPVLLDVTDTPGEKGEVSVRQQPVGQQKLAGSNTSRTWWRAPVVREDLQTNWPGQTGPGMTTGKAPIRIKVIFLWTHTISKCLHKPAEGLAATHRNKWKTAGLRNAAEQRKTNPQHGTAAQKLLGSKPGN